MRKPPRLRSVAYRPATGPRGRPLQRTLSAQQIATFAEARPGSRPGLDLFPLQYRVALPTVRRRSSVIGNAPAARVFCPSSAVTHLMRRLHRRHPAFLRHLPRCDVKVPPRCASPETVVALPVLFLAAAGRAAQDERFSSPPSEARAPGIAADFKPFMRDSPVFQSEASVAAIRSYFLQHQVFGVPMMYRRFSCLRNSMLSALLIPRSITQIRSDLP